MYSIKITDNIMNLINLKQWLIIDFFAQRWYTLPQEVL